MLPPRLRQRASEMYQLFRIDLDSFKKIKVGNMNESREFLVDCVSKEYPEIDLVVDEAGNFNVTGRYRNAHGQRAADVWTIEPVRLFTQ